MPRRLDFTAFFSGSTLAPHTHMATTAINQPSRIKGDQLLNVIVVMAAIVASLVLLFSVTYFMYRNAPENGTPYKIDTAQGVTPRDVPATPAVPEANPNPY